MATKTGQVFTSIYDGNTYEVYLNDDGTPFNVLVAGDNYARPPQMRGEDYKAAPIPPQYNAPAPAPAPVPAPAPAPVQTNAAPAPAPTYDAPAPGYAPASSPMPAMPLPPPPPPRSNWSMKIGERLGAFNPAQGAGTLRLPQNLPGRAPAFMQPGQRPPMPGNLPSYPTPGTRPVLPPLPNLPRR